MAVQGISCVTVAGISGKVVDLFHILKSQNGEAASTLPQSIQALLSGVSTSGSPVRIDTDDEAISLFNDSVRELFESRAQHYIDSIGLKRYGDTRRRPCPYPPYSSPTFDPLLGHKNNPHYCDPSIDDPAPSVPGSPEEVSDRSLEELEGEVVGAIDELVDSFESGPGMTDERKREFKSVLRWFGQHARPSRLLALLDFIRKLRRMRRIRIKMVPITVVPPRIGIGERQENPDGTAEGEVTLDIYEWPRLSESGKRMLLWHELMHVAEAPSDGDTFVDDPGKSPSENAGTRARAYEAHGGIYEFEVGWLCIQICEEEDEDTKALLCNEVRSAAAHAAEEYHKAADTYGRAASKAQDEGNEADAARYSALQFEAEIMAASYDNYVCPCCDEE